MLVDEVARGEGNYCDEPLELLLDGIECVEGLFFQQLQGVFSKGCCHSRYPVEPPFVDSLHGLFK